jgi:hypothetical protein
MVSHVLSLCTRPDSLVPRPKYSWALIPQHSLKGGGGSEGPRDGLDFLETKEYRCQEINVRILHLTL